MAAAVKFVFLCHNFYLISFLFSLFFLLLTDTEIPSVPFWALNPRYFRRLYPAPLKSAWNRHHAEPFCQLGLFVNIHLANLNAVSLFRNFFYHGGSIWQGRTKAQNPSAPAAGTLLPPYEKLSLVIVTAKKKSSFF